MDKLGRCQRKNEAKFTKTVYKSSHLFKVMQYNSSRTILGLKNGLEWIQTYESYAELRRQ